MKNPPVVDENSLISAMGTSGLEQRSEAIAQAARWIEPEVLGLLVANGADSIRRNAALEALTRQGPYAVPFLRAQMSQPDPELVMFLTIVLGEIADPVVIPDLLPLLDHPDPNVSTTAMTALGALRATEAVPSLIKCAKGDFWLQFAAVTALGEIGDPAATELLLGLLDDPMLSEPAARALARIAPAEALDPLVARLRLGQDVVVHPLAEIVANSADCAASAACFSGASATPWFQALQAKGSSGIEVLKLATGELEQVAEVLAELGEEGNLERVSRAAARLAPVLRPLAGDLSAHTDHRVREGLAEILTLTPDITATLLDDPNQDVRLAAIRQASENATVVVVEKMLRMLGRDKREDRAIRTALARVPAENLEVLDGMIDMIDANDLGTTAVLQILARSHRSVSFHSLKSHLDSSDVRRRKAAAGLLPFCPEPEAMEFLLAGLKSEDSDLRAAALAAFLAADTAPEGLDEALTALILQPGEDRHAAMRVLARFPLPKATSAMLESFDGMSEPEKIEGLRVVHLQGGAGHHDFLLDLVMGEPSDVRRAACRAFALEATKDDLEHLRKMAIDPDWNVRVQSVTGLARVDPEGNRGWLLDLARDVEPVVANAARAAMAS